MGPFTLFVRTARLALQVVQHGGAAPAVRALYGEGRSANILRPLFQGDKLGAIGSPFEFHGWGFAASFLTAKRRLGA
jgi:hypothetical protein